MPGSVPQHAAVPVLDALAEELGALARNGWTGPAGDLLVAVRGSDAVRRVRFGAAGGPEVRLAASAEDLDGLHAGELDGALLYLAARLDVEGDTGFLLELAPSLTLAGAGAPRALIDPQALAPEAVAAAIQHVTDEHLAAVMAGGFRDLVLGEVFRRLPEFLDAEKAARSRVAVAFVVGGRTAGRADRYVVRVDRGTCVVHADPARELPADASLLLDGPQFLRLVLGQLSPVRAVLGGQVRVSGELIKALGFSSVMRIPGI